MCITPRPRGRRGLSERFFLAFARMHGRALTCRCRVHMNVVRAAYDKINFRSYILESEMPSLPGNENLQSNATISADFNRYACASNVCG
jgi:hypothetical protein